MKRLFIDMDNTIVDYNQAAVDWYNEELGVSPLKVQDLVEYEIWRAYEVYPEEGALLDEKMWDTDGFWRNMEPYRDALNVIRGLMKRFDVWIVSRPQYNYNCVYEKWEWVRVHLLGLEKKMLFITENGDTLSGDILLDDSFMRTHHFQGTGLLYSQYYNTQYAEHVGYYVCNWKEVEELLNGPL